MTPSRNLPIGIFDSGIGGLTVVRELRKVLPHEDLVYLGDTARVPYGTKSPSTVTRFAVEDTAFLVQQNVKAVVVACNTASAWALPTLESRFKVPIFGVIHPGVEAALEQSRQLRIGVIGTAATIRSRAYETALLARQDKVKVFTRACPLLVPLVEEGWMNHAVTRTVLEEYRAPLLRKKIDCLVLGCTHYPLLTTALRKLTGPGVHLVDSAESCARHVRRQLETSGLLHPHNSRKGTILSYVTDETGRFSALATRFLGAPVQQAWRVDLPTVAP
jgi:glutamate racemase